MSGSAGAIDLSEDAITLRTGGKVYGGWTQMRVGRAIDHGASDLDISVTERWTGQDEAWQIMPFADCEVRIGRDPVLTGYVESYDPEFSATSHQVRVRARSRTQDLIECTPDLEAGVFNGYTLEAIARSICALFKIDVVVETDGAKEIVADAKLERCETAWSFLERLCRMAGVLACDDPQGRLVLTRAGAARASGALIQGQNMLRARGIIDVRKRYSNYIIKGQHGIGGGKGGGLDLTGLSGPGPASTGAKATSAVKVAMHAEAIDLGVPRYRPHVSLAESQITPELMQLRVNWQRAYAYGRAIQAQIWLKGFRQPDGSLWQINQIVPVASTYLGIDMELLTTRVEYSLDGAGGRVTMLSVGPVEGWTPDPGQVKLHKHKGHKGHKGALDLSGLAPG